MNDLDGLATDDGGGQMLGGEPAVARRFLEAPEVLAEYLIRTGSSAILADILDWQRALQTGLKYRNRTLVANAVQWFLATRGADGEANHIASSTAVGQLHELAFYRRPAGRTAKLKGLLRKDKDAEPAATPSNNGAQP